MSAMSRASARRLGQTRANESLHETLMQSRSTSRRAADGSQSGRPAQHLHPNPSGLAMQRLRAGVCSVGSCDPLPTSRPDHLGREQHGHAPARGDSPAMRSPPLADQRRTDSRVRPARRFDDPDRGRCRQRSTTLQLVRRRSDTRSGESACNARSNLDSWTRR
jgi:hypothetical protein